MCADPKDYDNKHKRPFRVLITSCRVSYLSGDCRIVKLIWNLVGIRFDASYEERISLKWQKFVLLNINKKRFTCTTLLDLEFPSERSANSETVRSLSAVASSPSRTFDY